MRSAPKFCRNSRRGCPKWLDRLVTKRCDFGSLGVPGPASTRKPANQPTNQCFSSSRAMCGHHVSHPGTHLAIFFIVIGHVWPSRVTVWTRCFHLIRFSKQWFQLGDPPVHRISHGMRCSRKGAIGGQGPHRARHGINGPRCGPTRCTWKVPKTPKASSQERQEAQKTSRNKALVALVAGPARVASSLPREPFLQPQRLPKRFAEGSNKRPREVCPRHPTG